VHGVPSSDDLRYFLEVHRRGSLSAAARVLKVNQTTIGRRLKALEREVGAQLVRVTAAGARLTEAGREILAEAEHIERALAMLQRKVAGHVATISGVIRIATTEALASTFLMPRLARLHARHPNLEFVVLASNQSADLARGEADLALRLVKPDGHGLVARKVGQIELGVFAAGSYLAERGAPDFSDELAGHDVLGYHGALAEGTEARWLAKHGVRARVVLRVNSVLNLLAAANAGLGIAILPTALAEDSTLRRLEAPTQPEGRGVWTVYHEAARADARIRSIVDDLVANARDPAAFPRARRS
jgi:DNA-binding transcriptional LysR family regulator